jgi:site-specific DNA recombinase
MSMSSIAIYARVSSEIQTRKQTIESQIAALKQRLQKEGHAVVPDDVYEDDGYSGSTLLRPALERLRDRVAEGGVDVVYVHSPDRLARRYAFQVLLLDEFSRHGTSVVFLEGRSATSPEDELLLQVQGVIAEYERAKIIERSRRGKLHQAKRGVVNALSNAPYGFIYVKKADGVPASYQVFLPEAQIVREMFDKLVHEHRSVRSIAVELDKRQVPTRNGGRQWHPSTVAKILRNPACMGKAGYGKTLSCDPKPALRLRSKAPARRVHSSSRARAQSEWLYIDVPAIISAELFEAAQLQLERNYKQSPRHLKGFQQRYLLRSLLQCSCCGHQLYGKTSAPRHSVKAGRTTAYQYYRCRGNDRHLFAGQRICHSPQVRCDALDGYVWSSIKALLQNPDRVLAEWRRRTLSDESQTELEAHAAKLKRISNAQQQSLQRLLDVYEAGLIDLDDFRTRTQRIRVLMHGVERQLDDAQQHIAQHQSMREVVCQLESFSETVRRRLDDLDWDQRRQLVRTLIDHIKVDPDGASTGSRGSTTMPARATGCRPHDRITKL